MTTITDVQKCKDYAIACHANVNHQYDGKPYSVHLELAHHFACMWLHLLPEDLRSEALGGAWTHDVIEDARQSYNDVKLVCGERVAEVAYACSNDKGKTRKERAGDKYYQGIRDNQAAWFDKICDRMANVWYGKNTESSMYEVYRKEQPDFEKELFCLKFKPMFDYLNQLLDPSYIC